MMAKWRLVWDLARLLDGEELAQFLRMVRLRGLPMAARALADRHTVAIGLRLERHLGRLPTEQELEIAKEGFVGVIEGMS